MSDIRQHLQKDRLHHAYLIEGAKDSAAREVTEFLIECGMEENSPDFCRISIDNFKMDEALNLKAMSQERGEGKKFFLVAANHFSLDAQNTLLKMFEEPSEDTHLFLITPDSAALLPTLISRLYFIPAGAEEKNLSEAEDFIKSPPSKRVALLKDILSAPEDEVMDDSVRAKAMQFLNNLELALHKQIMSKTVFDTEVFEQIFKTREYLRQPGASPKTLLESVALLIP